MRKMYGARIELVVRAGVLYQSLPQQYEFEIHFNYEPYSCGWCHTTEEIAIENAIDWVAITFLQESTGTLHRRFSVASRAFTMRVDPSTVHVDPFTVVVDAPLERYPGRRADQIAMEREFAARLEQEIRRGVETSQLMRDVLARAM